MGALLIGVATQGFTQDSLKNSVIIEQVDVVPQFKGGIRGWQTYLQNNLDLNDVVEAMDSVMYANYGSKQSAILEFIVCEDGEVCEVNVVNKNKVSPEFAKEVLRIMKRSPKWVPAMKDGKPVRTRFRQPIVAIIE